MSSVPGWTADPEVVLAAFRLDRQYCWLDPEASAHRTVTGVRLRIPGFGVVADADPASDGSWWVRAYRVSPADRAARQPVDAGVFDLAVAVWELDAREADWCVVVPPRRGRVEADVGRRVAQSLLDALEGDVSRDWYDTYPRYMAMQREQADWQQWARDVRGKSSRVLGVEGQASGVWLRNGHAAAMSFLRPRGRARPSGRLRAGSRAAGR